MPVDMESQAHFAIVGSNFPWIRNQTYAMCEYAIPVHGVTSERLVADR